VKAELLENIEQAFLQLAFAIKLLAFLDLKKIDKNEFDIDLILGKHGEIAYGHGTFNTYDDLINAAHNNFNLTLGFTAITLETSLQTAGISNNPSDQSPNGMLRTLIYMIRNAYAHDLMHPKWEVKGQYRKQLIIELQNETVELDLSEKHGQPFDVKDIGGHETYFQIKEKICQLIEESY
jgi:hypothetical protein